MNLNRRKFIKAAGGLALAGISQAVPSLAALQDDSSRGDKLRVAVFYEESFPSVDFTPIGREALQNALRDFQASFLNLNELVDRLRVDKYDVFVTPYGSAFPKSGFESIQQYLARGGNWVNLGGIPFSVPVDHEAAGWRQEVRQTVHHKRLGITQAFPVSARSIASYVSAQKWEGFQSLLKGISAEEVYELYVRFAVSKDFPNEDGSAGPRDALLIPVVVGLNKDSTRIAAPVIQIDRMMGEYAGGRWVLANFKGAVTGNAIRDLVAAAARGSSELVVRSTFACYRGGEMPMFSAAFRHPRGNADSMLDGDCEMEITDEHGSAVDSVRVRLKGEGALAMASAGTPGRKGERFAGGFYRVRSKVKVKSTQSVPGYEVRHETGFWMMDANLLAGGKPLELNKNYFLRDGSPYPVTGTTYMTSDVHRKFLFEPNPSVWDRDFSEMKRTGINMVRTGMWTSWKNYMLDVGSPAEAPLRALDAFILTARKYDIPVVFTLFAFLPESWGGENAYLDPRSINGQKEFLSAIAQRYSAVNDIIWDLINEPSFCNPQHLWSCRPNYDSFERDAWSSWLKNRMHATTDADRRARLQEEYREAADEPLSLPTLEDFDSVNIFERRRPVKVVDYKLFAQEMFSQWVKEVSATIRANGNSHQLITVGQDEGGTGESPAQQFFAGAVDFTSIHNWWLNDDLVWDSIVSKNPLKANLVEETGVMFCEKMDGSAWRTEEEARNLLERKLAISMGTGGAGFLEWIWNANPYMQSDNEAAIGLYRVDGTAKPEFEPVARFARFFAANRNLMTGKKGEDVVMVIPHSQMFSTRNYATEATKRCVRTMSYDLGIPLAAVSEYRLDAIQSLPKLIVLPSPRTFNQAAWDGIVSMVERGSTLLLTGPIDDDEHWLPVRRLKQFNIIAETEPVAEEEYLIIDDREHRLSFRGEKIQRVEKGMVDEDDPQEVMTVPYGKGLFIWSPLPVELSDNVEALPALYEFALKQSRVESSFAPEKTDPAVLVLPAVFNNATLYTVVCESDRDSKVRFTDKETKATVEVDVEAKRAAMVFVSRKDGSVLSRLD